MQNVWFVIRQFQKGYTIVIQIYCIFIHFYDPGIYVIVPLPKNKRSIKCCTGNYRSITNSSILIIIILHVQYYHLSTDVLQFGYKEYTTMMYTYLLLETINNDCVNQYDFYSIKV